MDVFEFIADMTWLPAVCFAIGFLLVIIEMFYPGFGVFGISGAILLILGVVFTADTLIEAIILVLLIIAILGIILTIVLKMASKGILSKKVILQDKLDDDSGFRGTEDLAYLLGKEGVVQTILRPSGTADFDGVKLDVVSQGEFIGKEERVKIIEVEGRRIVVGKIK